MVKINFYVIGNCNFRKCNGDQRGKLVPLLISFFFFFPSCFITSRLICQLAVCALQQHTQQAPAPRLCHRINTRPLYASFPFLLTLFPPLPLSLLCLSSVINIYTFVESQSFEFEDEICIEFDRAYGAVGNGLESG